MSPAWTLLTTSSKATRALLVAVTTAGIAARLAVYASAAAIIDRRTAAITVFATVAALAWLVQRALGALLRPQVECDIQRATSRAMLESDVLAVATEDLHRVVWDGQFHARAVIGQTIPSLAADAVVTVVLVPLVVRELPSRVLVLALAALAALLLTTVALRRANARLQAVVLEASQRVSDKLTLAVDGRLEIAARGGEEHHARAFESALDAYRRRARRSSLASAILGRVPLAAGLAVIALIAVVDASARDGLATAVFARALMLAAAASPLIGAVMSLNDVVRGDTQTRPLVSLITAPRRIELVQRGDPPPTLPAEVAVEKLSFAYSEKGPEVISDLSFRWKPSEPLVLIGTNGSGKSTLLRLLLGLRRPARGKITVGDADLWSIDLVAFRRGVAFLPQRPYLGEPYTTVRAGLLLAGAPANDATAKDALVRVGLDVDLDAPVGELSAGQRQRVALARVLLADAQLVLLDEPDANLDREGVALVARLVSELTDAGKMVAVVAHGTDLGALGGLTVTLSRAAVKEP